ncbi:MAG: TrkH family potassium uptake protein [Verrucomicrobiae bacterium]|nr:TrkH family potassium uptake protein [Verrucomicrobiae bacterium]
MNFRIIAKTLGLLVILVGLAMGVCWIYARILLQLDPAATGSRDASWSLAISTSITLGIGAILFLVGKGGSNEILRREAMVIVGLAWVLAGIFGALPYVFGNPTLDPAGAVFESISGFTTTGSSVMSNIESFPPAILLWRSVTQWLGGIGILVVFVAVLSFLGVGSRSLVQQESSINLSDAGASRIRDVASSLLKVYLFLTVLCGAGLYAFGMPPFEAVCHGMTTIATGGFSPKNASIAHYQSPAIELWLSLFMFLSSIGFMFYVFLATRRWTRVRSEEEGRYYLLLVTGMTLAIAADLVLVRKDESFLLALREAVFNVTSISSTTGFGVSDYDQWPLFSKLLLMLLMLIGGCAGSTAGGLKMNRIVLFFKITFRELVKSYRPNRVFRLKLNGVSPPEQVLVTTLFIITLGLGIAGFSVLLVAMLEPGLDLVSLIGAVFGTLWNVGPGFGDVGPTDNFSALKPPTLVLLSFLMILGRLEFFALIVLFVPSLWRKY